MKVDIRYGVGKQIFSYNKQTMHTNDTSNLHKHKHEKTRNKNRTGGVGVPGETEEKILANGKEDVLDIAAVQKVVQQTVQRPVHREPVTCHVRHVTDVNQTVEARDFSTTGGSIVNDIVRYRHQIFWQNVIRNGRFLIANEIGV